MARLLFLLSFFALGCSSQPSPGVLRNNDWQIVEIVDGKEAPGSPFNFSYRYNPVTDSMKAYIRFLSDSSYVLQDLFGEGRDTNYYSLHNDTLFTNREPQDYLVISQGKNDTLFLTNQEQKLVFTLIKAQ